ncbi:MAG: CPBP family intramembrane metalloprotease [Polyangiaceae bacterium]|nr:CPBP family intramembrane metalloprotease [Polyangiaceae bacterium]
MGVFGALSWTFATVFGFAFLRSAATSLRPTADFDIITLVFAQIIATGFAVFAILRVYAPNASARRLFGLRGTSVALYPLALVFGVAATILMSKMNELVELRWPRSPDPHGFDQLLVTNDRLRRIVMGIFIGLVSPFVEEVFFRGALFTPLRKLAQAPASSHDEEQRASRPTTPDRTSPLFVPVGVTTAVFVFAHGDWRQAVPLALVALVMGVLRYRSGSLIPSFLVHVALNSLSVVAVYTLRDMTTIPWSWVAIASIVSAASLAGMLLLCRGERAALARADEL